MQVPQVIKFCFLLMAFMRFNDVYAQVFKGQILDKQDSSAVPFVNVVAVNGENGTINGTTADNHGSFELDRSDAACTLRFVQSLKFAELRIIKIEPVADDTVDLGIIYMVRAPTYLQVQFKGVTDQEEKEAQRQIIKEYNKKVKNYEDITVQYGRGKYTMRVKPEREENTGRLLLIYTIDFRDLTKAMRQ